MKTAFYLLSALLYGSIGLGRLALAQLNDVARQGNSCRLGHFVGLLLGVSHAANVGEMAILVNFWGMG